MASFIKWCLRIFGFVFLIPGLFIFVEGFVRSTKDHYGADDFAQMANIGLSMFVSGLIFLALSLIVEVAEIYIKKNKNR